MSEESPAAAGNLRQRPLARVLCLLDRKTFTGRVEIDGPEGTLRVFVRDGGTCFVETPVVCDTLGQILLESGLLSIDDFHESLVRVAKEGRKHGEVLRDMGVLDLPTLRSALLQQLRRKIVRAFAIDDADFRIFAVDHPHGAGETEGLRVDALWAVLAGVRSCYTDERLRRDLARLDGLELRVVPAFAEAGLRFGMSAEEQTAIELIAGRFLPVAEFANASGLGPVASRMLIYALWVTDLLESRPAAGAAAGAAVDVPRPPAPGEAGAVGGTTARMDWGGSSAGARPPSGAAAARPASGSPAPSPATPPKDTEAFAQRVAEKVKAIDGSDHFAALEVPRDAAREGIHDAYLELARVFHPDRLAGLGLDRLRPDVERIFHRVGDAHRVLDDDAQREEYLATLTSGAAGAPGAAEADATAQARRLIDAEVTFQKGLVALRRNDFAGAEELFRAAVRMNPDEGEHLALLAWATYTNPARDRAHTREEVKDMLTRGCEMSPRCARAFYYLGQVLHEEGRTKEAIAAYEHALQTKPDYLEVERELRIIRMRQEKERSRGGLLDRLRKK